LNIAYTNMGRRRGRSFLKIRWKNKYVKIALGVTMFLILVGAGGFWYLTRSLPEPGKLSASRAGSLVVLDKNGKIVHQLFKDKQHLQVTSDEIPQDLKNAIVAIEDKNFYNHSGFDPFTIVRIPFNYIFRGGRVVGGSTLTQQLIKQAYLDSSRTVTRKIKEFVLAIEIEKKLTKDEILTEYLNIAPYGGTFEGVGAASRGYFDKNVEDLTLLESAILAGLPQRPSVYSPFIGERDAWKNRTKDVLRRMKEDKYISDKQYEDVLKQLNGFKFANREVSIRAPHFVFFIRDEAEKLVGVQAMKQGVIIQTALDTKLQKEAEKIVHDEVRSLKSSDVGNGASLVYDANTGEIITMVGSYDFADEKYGKFNVTADENALRQPGSTLKPLLVASALDKKIITASSVIMDVKTAFPVVDQADYEPVNYDGKYRGPVQIRFALGNSLNVPMVKLMGMYGLRDFLAKMEELGISSLAPTQANLSRLGLAVSLGGGDIRLTELAGAYMALARGGTTVEVNSIREIRDNSGKLLYRRPEKKVKKVFSKEASFIVSHILSDNVARRDVFGDNSLLVIPNKTVAVKTGTTNDKRDNWTVGYTKDIVVVVWVGNNDNTPMNPRIASGITGASPIWNKIMKFSLSTYSDGIVDKPDSVNVLEIDSFAGGKVREEDKKRSEYFISETEPKEVSTVYQRIKISKNQSNKKANDKEIEKGQFDERDFFVFREDDPVSTDGRNRWQDGIDAWTREQSDDKYKPPGETSDHVPVEPTPTSAPTSQPTQSAPTQTPAPTSANTPTPTPQSPTPTP
jgi:penicillin-binding protein 1C